MFNNEIIIIIIIIIFIYDYLLLYINKYIYFFI